MAALYNQWTSISSSFSLRCVLDSPLTSSCASRRVSSRKSNLFAAAKSFVQVDVGNSSMRNCDTMTFVWRNTTVNENTLLVPSAHLPPSPSHFVFLSPDIKSMSLPSNGSIFLRNKYYVLQRLQEEYLKSQFLFDMDISEIWKNVSCEISFYRAHNKMRDNFSCFINYILITRANR